MMSQEGYSFDSPSRRQDPLLSMPVDFKKWREHREQRENMQDLREPVDTITAIDTLFKQTYAASHDNILSTDTDTSVVEAMLPKEESDTIIFNETQQRSTLAITAPVAAETPGRVRRTLGTIKALGQAIMAQDHEITIPPLASPQSIREKTRFGALFEKRPSKKVLAATAVGLAALSSVIFGLRGNTEQSENIALAQHPAVTTTLPGTEATSTTPTQVLDAQIEVEEGEMTTAPAQEELQPSEAAFPATEITITITKENNSLWKALKSQNPTATNTEIQNAINDIADRYNIDPDIVYNGNQFTLN